MEGLSLDNMMTGEEAAALFDPESNKEETEETPSENPNENKEENKETTEVVDVDTLFTDKPESVGSEDNKEQEGTSSTLPLPKPLQKMVSSKTLMMRLFLRLMMQNLL